MAYSADDIVITSKFALDLEMGWQFKTSVRQLSGAYEERNQDWTLGFRRYRGQLVNRDLSEIQTFDRLFAGRRGAAHPFLLLDPIDQSLTDENIGTGDDSTTTFQITKAYTDSVRPFYRYITAVSGLVVKVNGVTQTVTTDYTETDGVITFTSAPANGHAITVSCNFWIRVRFATDYVPMLLSINPNVGTPYASTGAFDLIEVLR